MIRRLKKDVSAGWVSWVGVDASTRVLFGPLCAGGCAPSVKSQSQLRSHSRTVPPPATLSLAPSTHIPL